MRHGGVFRKAGVRDLKKKKKEILIARNEVRVERPMDYNVTRKKKKELNVELELGMIFYNNFSRHK